MHWNQNFSPISAKEWKQKIQFELAGLDYNETLTSNIEGIQVKPFYHKEDLDYLKIFPIEAQKNWKKITTKAKFAEFADAIWLQEIPSFTLKKKIFLNLDLTKTTEQDFHSIFEKQNISLAVDFYGFLEKTGNWWQEKPELSESVLSKLINKSSMKKCILVDASFYQNAGATHIEQIAFCLLKINEYITLFGIEAAKKMMIKTAVGSNYFFETAKLRSLRFLWQTLLKAYHLENQELFLIAESSFRNKSYFDWENNLIRATLEASSTIQGKADALLIHSYELGNPSSEKSEELAIKQQLLLDKESHFTAYSDAIYGSYYIEHLVDLMNQKAWKLFQEMEKSGGYLSHLFKGNIQKRIQQSHKKEQAAFDSGEITLIGVNKFRKEGEIPVSIPKNKRQHKVLFPIISEQRLSQSIDSK